MARPTEVKAVAAAISEPAQDATEAAKRRCQHPSGKCERPYMQQGYCCMHRSRLVRTGDLGPVGPLWNPDNLSFYDFLMANIVEREEGGCVEWTGTTHRGYGITPKYKGDQRAQRVFYRYFTGEAIPPGMQVDHVCRNRACVAISHLEVVSPRENILRSESATARNARKTHCKRGHELTVENIQAGPWERNGYRVCRLCKRIQNRKDKAKRRGKTV